VHEHITKEKKNQLSKINTKVNEFKPDPRGRNPRPTMLSSTDDLPEL
jgi:hypothetical protein